MKKINLYGLYGCIFLTSLFVPIVGNSKAQKLKRPHLKVEADPLAYVLNGYSLHLALS